MELQVDVLSVIPKCWQVTLKGGEEWKELWRVESEMLYYVIQCENSYENTWKKWCKFRLCSEEMVKGGRMARKMVDLLQLGMPRPRE